MRYRCMNPKNKDYANYGGRGITVCENWMQSFDSFIKDVGYRPSPLHSLDRIDNDGNYEPNNVRWATAMQQANNRRKIGASKTEANNQRKVNICVFDPVRKKWSIKRRSSA
jgi:hypothetical protein